MGRLVWQIRDVQFNTSTIFYCLYYVYLYRLNAWRGGTELANRGKTKQQTLNSETIIDFDASQLLFPLAL